MIDLAIFYGYMWYLSLPVAAISGTIMILILLDVNQAIMPWQGYMDTLSGLEILRLIFCSIFLLLGGIWGSKGLILDLRGRGILSLMMSQSNISKP
ncbi:hypothetical protein A3194_12345 [Candidatus Thiodiazotropha endoloripes]|nr:hypothetical protein A3194_12345 [Candidatus Thiodiazotropha endoloripes]